MHPARHRLSRIPPAVSRWLGYRSSPQRPLPFYIVVLWSFIGSLCGLVAIQAAFCAHYFTRRAVPSVIASYGASAVLIYGSIESPLAQPRSLIGGHFIGAFLGICISKLFQFMPSDYYAHLQWLGGSLAVSLCIVAMQLTRTVHPPAGATALLAVVNQEVVDLSWYLLPVVLLSSTLALVVALIINNIQRRYPVFWFTADAPPPPLYDHEAGKTKPSDAQVDKGTSEDTSPKVEPVH